MAAILLTVLLALTFIGIAFYFAFKSEKKAKENTQIFAKKQRYTKRNISQKEVYQNLLEYDKNIANRFLMNVRKD